MSSAFLWLLDDVTFAVKKSMVAAQKAAAASLDDVALASQKAMGVVVDDAAVVPQYAHGISPARELPMVFKMTLGSLLNKLILVPLALWASVSLPAVIPWVLMLGGAFLAYEGFEAVLEKYFHAHGHVEDLEQEVLEMPPEVFEKSRVFSAIKTDFVLSAEIVVIAMGTLMDRSFEDRAVALAITGLAITIGVYGVVACLVKMDDIGLHLMEKPSSWIRSLGRGVVKLMPKVMTAISHVGTWAMLLVGGGIFLHEMEHWDRTEAALEILKESLGGAAIVVSPVLSILLALAIGFSVLMGLKLLSSIVQKLHKE